MIDQTKPGFKSRWRDGLLNARDCAILYYLRHEASEKAPIAAAQLLGWAGIFFESLRRSGGDSTIGGELRKLRDAGFVGMRLIDGKGASRTKSGMVNGYWCTQIGEEWILATHTFFDRLSTLVTMEPEAIAKLNAIANLMELAEETESP